MERRQEGDCRKLGHRKVGQEGRKVNHIYTNKQVATVSKWGSVFLGTLWGIYMPWD